MDSHPFHDVPNQAAMLEAHLSAIKRHPAFSRANIVFFPERNTGHEGGHMKLIVDKFGGYTYRERSDRDFGIWTSEETKKNSAERARAAMAEGSVYLMDDFITVNQMHDKKDESERRKAMKEEFEHQLLRYKYVYSQTKTPFGKSKYTISGKTDKNGGISSSVNDDLAVCFCFLILINELIATNQLINMDYSYCPDHKSSEKTENRIEAMEINRNLYQSQKKAKL